MPNNRSYNSVNPYEDQFRDSSEQKALYGMANHTEPQSHDRADSHNESRNKDSGLFVKENSSRHRESNGQLLPELSKTELKVDRFQPPNSIGRAKGSNKSIDLNSYELAKFFE